VKVGSICILPAALSKRCRMHPNPSNSIPVFFTSSHGCASWRGFRTSGGEERGGAGDSHPRSPSSIHTEARWLRRSTEAMMRDLAEERTRTWRCRRNIPFQDRTHHSSLQRQVHVAAGGGGGLRRTGNGGRRQGGKKERTHLENYAPDLRGFM
jgi:hypothetical protein